MFNEITYTHHRGVLNYLYAALLYMYNKLLAFHSHALLGTYLFWLITKIN